MLTAQQKKWINHLSNTDKIKIIPYDPSTKEKFEKIKARILSTLGKTTRVEHCGATSLGISGQDEIDVYIPVPPRKFDQLVLPLTKLFGPPGSLYPLRRARFETHEQDKHVTVFLINQDHPDWINGIKFENYLKANPKALEKYRQLKEAGQGLSTREYYCRKNEFINRVLAKVV